MYLFLLNSQFMPTWPVDHITFNKKKKNTFFEKVEGDGEFLGRIPESFCFTLKITRKGRGGNERTVKSFILLVVSHF